METPADDNDRSFSCPVPKGDYASVTLAHGGGGKLSSDLVRQIFLPAFGGSSTATLADSAVLPATGHRIAFSTDSYVVRPLFFPGGSIADLAINGTVNDLAMVGAKPCHLSVAFIVEEGLPMADLEEIAKRMGDAAQRAEIEIVTGDTKVVEKGHGDGCYITTSGVGIIAEGVEIGPERAEPGDVIIQSGTLGDHGMAIMSVREGLEFESQIRSDSAPLASLVAEMIQTCPEIHVLRDPTRGGLAASLNEIAAASGHGIEIEESELPIRSEVASACEILGLDPLFVANEGKLVCIAPESYAEALLSAMRGHEFGKEARIIGKVVADHPGYVTAKTAIGASRVVTVPVGEQLPRIC